MAAQVADAAGGEAMTICRGPLLPIEDAGDHTIGVMGREPAQQRDRVLVGADGGRPRARQSEVDLVERAALPAQRRDGLAALSRSTLIVTSSMRVRSSSFLSRGVVVGAFQTAARSGPSARRRSRSACEITRGLSFSRRSSSILAVSSARRRSSQSRSRPRATSRLSGSTAR